MVNQLKIITMTQLALYDKHEGPHDRVANDYFRHDYIYRNNLGTRLAVGLGGIIILIIYWVRSFIVNGMDLFEFEIQQHVTDSIFFILAILAVYSLIGTIQGTRQYYLVQKRLAQYQALVRQLERLEERARRVYDDEEPAPEYEDTAPKRYNTSPPVRTAPPIEHTRPVRRQPPPAPGHTHTGPMRRPPQATPGGTGSRPPMPPGHTRPTPRPRPQPTSPIEHTRVVPRPRPAETEE